MAVLVTSRHQTAVRYLQPKHESRVVLSNLWIWFSIALLLDISYKICPQKSLPWAWKSWSLEYPDFSSFLLLFLQEWWCRCFLFSAAGGGGGTGWWQRVHTHLKWLEHWREKMCWLENKLRTCDASQDKFCHDGKRLCFEWRKKYKCKTAKAVQCPWAQASTLEGGEKTKETEFNRRRKRRDSIQ